MTVQELIDLLLTMPPGLVVMVNPYDGAAYTEARAVELRADQVYIDEGGID